MSAMDRLSQNRIVRGLIRRIHERQQQFALGRAMPRFLRNPSPTSAGFDSALLEDLVYGWGNHHWSVASANGPILECGSGLSTILIGILAQQARLTVWSLEHEPTYAAHVQKYLDKYRVNSVRLCVAPLKQYGDFDWYAPPLASMPGDFALVVCDGPPGSTRGGRYGLVPVMREKLRADCTILLDDGARPDEQAVATHWARELDCEMEINGSQKPFVVMKLGQTA